MRTKLWLENLKRRDHIEDLSVNGKIILEMTFGEYGEVLSGCTSLRIWISGKLL
jgi:hypothetical protein